MQDILIFMQHHLLLSLALVVVLVLLMVLEFVRGKHGAKQLSPHDVVRMMNRENAVIVDLRSTDAFTSGHIVDAVSLPFSDIREKHKKLEKFKTQPIIVVCATGQESARAAIQLQTLGYTVEVMAGGMQAWRGADLPLVKG